MENDQQPVEGCLWCSTTEGPSKCWIHGENGLIVNTGGSFATVKITLGTDVRDAEELCAENAALKEKIKNLELRISRQRAEIKNRMLQLSDQERYQKHIRFIVMSFPIEEVSKSASHGLLVKALKELKAVLDGKNLNCPKNS